MVHVDESDNTNRGLQSGSFHSGGVQREPFLTSIYRPMLDGVTIGYDQLQLSENQRNLFYYKTKSKLIHPRLGQFFFRRTEVPSS